MQVLLKARGKKAETGEVLFALRRAKNIRISMVHFLLLTPLMEWRIGQLVVR